ncbi:MAG: OmpA family protein [Bauldia sp.]|mgnify:CR=1 FL=1
MKSLLATLVLALGLGALADGAAAQTVSGQAIIDALKPAPRTRDIGAPDAQMTQSQSNLVSNLRKTTRAIQVEEREELATIVAQPAVRKIDLEVYFPLNSSLITPQATPLLINLGFALRSKDLQGGVYLVSGHTDITGPAAYNIELSQARAISVKRFLVENFRIDPSTLIAVGYGAEHLKNPANPAGGENRRVAVAALPTR